MNKFELSFELPNQRNNYIAPLLLPDDKPTYTWDDRNNLRLRYEYDFMPKGILARFIVRQHQRIKEQLFWKRGVVLEYEDTLALVSEDYKGRNLSIAVQGKRAKELRFLISSEIDSINEGYHFSDRLSVTKYVPCNCEECIAVQEPHFYKYKLLERRIERGKKQTIECPISEEDVDVKTLLNTMLPQEEEQNMLSNTEMKKIFISYAHEDIAYKNKLETAFAMQRRNGTVSLWSDRQIQAGGTISASIEQQLQEADIFVLLLSPDFLADESFWNQERPLIEERHATRQAEVVPVLLRPCDWVAWNYVANLQAVPSDAQTGKIKAIAAWEDKDLALDIAVQAIKVLL